MIFKKLELHGFKSFFDRTEVHFRPGINAVVGPNGCGKSNIADAIRWVLGEQSPKQLRGEKMEDLIFGGSESRHPLGMAEVSLTVEPNGADFPAPYQQFTEVCVTRRLYRSGESEYFINNAPCRMRDIRELFLDTGMNPKAYAVIDQGSIGQLISAHPEDRRILFEEAAGIAKYKERKAAALRRLEATQQNLLRLGDVVQEIRRQINSLSRQARKAERYHELRAQAEELDLQVHFHQYTTLRERLRNHAERAHGLEDLRETLRNESAAALAALEAGRLDATGVEQALGTLREEFFRLGSRLEQLDQALAAAQARHQRLRESVARDASESDRLGALHRELETERESVVGELGGLEARIATLEQDLEESAGGLAESGAATRALRERLEEAKARFLHEVRGEGESQNRITHCRALLDTLEQELERTRLEVSRIDEAEASRAGQEAALEASHGERAASRAAASAAIERCAAALAAARGEVRELEESQALAREAVSSSGSRLASLTELERNIAGWPERFREELARLLAHGDLRGGVRGLLAEQLRCAPEHENALEAVLGERLKALVVTDTDLAASAARVLRGGEAVRGTFVPLHPRTGADAPAPTGPGVTGRLAARVECPAECRALLDHLLRDVWLVEDLDVAAALWSLDAGRTFVTPEGEVLWADGSVSAGRFEASRELLPILRKIRETQDEAHAAEARLQECGRLLDRSRDLVRELEGESARHADAARALDIEIASLEKDLVITRQRQRDHALQRERLTSRAAQASADRERLRAELEEAERRRTHILDARSREEEAVAALERESADAQRAERALVERHGAVQVELAAGRERIRHLRTRRDQLAHDAGDAAVRARTLAQQAAEARDEEAAVSAEVRSLHESRDGLAAERAAAEERLAAAQERQRLLSGGIREREELLRGLQARREELQEELASLQVRSAEDQVRGEHLRGRIVELRSCAPEELWDEPTRATVRDTPLAEIEQRHREASGQLQALGPVNLAAVGEQQELQERMEQMKLQQADLEAASQDLHQAIQKINASSRERFLETFERINEKFQEVFPMLFDRGHALLRLSGAEDPLEAGVEVLAQPAGKKLQQISLLSGGEKALTSIALLLSIFMVKPTPFCLLDEVDAPLDETNTRRFLSILTRSTDGSQLVMITHNKRTMESADHLVGVTMSDPGISRLISVQLREREAGSAA